MSADTTAPNPKRIQRKRTKGWRAPAGAVSVGRPGPWGNPFVIGKPKPAAWGNREIIETAREAIDLYRAWLAVDPNKRNSIRRELRGKDLMCWCRLDQVCHADVLLEIANA